MTRDFIRQADAAKLAAVRLGRPVAPATVRSWVARGRIRTAPTELGRAPIVRASLEEYLASRSATRRPADTGAQEEGST